MNRPERHTTYVPRPSEVNKHKQKLDQAELLELTRKKLDIQEQLKTENRQDRIAFLTTLLKSIKYREARLTEFLAKNKIGEWIKELNLHFVIYVYSKKK